MSDKIYQFMITEKGKIERTEYDYQQEKNTIYINAQIVVYVRNLDVWRMSYMYSFDPDMDKAAASLIKVLSERIERNEKIIESKVRTNAAYQKTLKKLKKTYKEV